MSPVRTLALVLGAAFIGACSENTQPTTAANEPGLELRPDMLVSPLRGFWSDGKGMETMHSPLLCNFGGTGPECLRVFHSATFVDHVYHRGVAQGTGCSRSVIRIGGILRGRSGFRCHRRGDILIFTWIVQEFHPYGTRIQVDYTGAGAASPTGFVYTNYR